MALSSALIEGWTAEPTQALPSTKIRLSLAHVARGSASEELVPAIVRVDRAGYVPPGIEVRSHIDPMLFTANLKPSLFAALEEDPDVISVSAAEALPVLAE